MAGTPSLLFAVHNIQSAHPLGNPSCTTHQPARLVFERIRDAIIAAVRVPISKTDGRRLSVSANARLSECEWTRTRK